MILHRLTAAGSRQRSALRHPHLSHWHGMGLKLRGACPSPLLSSFSWFLSVLSLSTPTSREETLPQAPSGLVFPAALSLFSEKNYTPGGEALQMVGAGLGRR